MNELFDIKGKVAVVTGASRGLGKATAIGLGKAGAKVAAADVLKTEETVELVRKTGNESFGFRTDVREKKEVESLIEETLAKFGKIDILINNAGINIIEPTPEVSEENFDKVMDVNIKGQFLCAQEVGNEMIEQRSGKIINISSINGEFAFPNAVAYNASKAGVLMLTRTLAYEWGKYNINVNAICPGFMETAMLKEIHKEKREMAKERLKKIPLGKFANPKDLVGSVIFLSSKASDYVTGHALYVDGGWTVGWPGVERASLDSKLAEELKD